MKEKILQPWDWLRVVRLIIGVSVVFQSVLMQSWLLVAAGVMLTAMAVLNIGCGLNGCSVPPARRDTVTETKDIHFEEVK
jgi:hypothetical protein